MIAAQIMIAPSTAVQVHGWLRKRVQQGELPPGVRISETEIAAAVGISRQPVREAFIRLASDGLAEIRPQRGTFVSRISVSAVRSARFIREAAEADLARIVAASCPPGILTAMQAEIAAQHRADKTADVDAFIESDDRFHALLAQAAGQAAVWADLERLKAQMNRLRHLSMRVLDRGATIGQHQRVLDAVAQGDPGKAEAAMRIHLQQMLSELPQMAAARPDYFTD